MQQFSPLYLPILIFTKSIWGGEGATNFWSSTRSECYPIAFATRRVPISQKKHLISSQSQLNQNWQPNLPWINPPSSQVTKIPWKCHAALPMKSLFCIPLSIPWKNHHKNTLEIPTETQLFAANFWSSRSGCSGLTGEDQALCHGASRHAGGGRGLWGFHGFIWLVMTFTGLAMVFNDGPNRIEIDGKHRS